MKRGVRIFSEESGFSLPELIIVVGLIPLVLAGAWGGLSFVTASSKVSSVQGNAAHDFANPMDQMSRMIMQNMSIKMASGNRIEVWTDRNMDGAPELDAFYVTADNRLVFERWSYTSDRVTVLAHNVWAMSTANHNVASGTAAFTYYDKAGVQIPASDVSAKAPSDATRVRVTLIIDMGNGTTARDVRDIVFRNRS